MDYENIALLIPPETTIKEIKQIKKILDQSDFFIDFETIEITDRGLLFNAQYPDTIGYDWAHIEKFIGLIDNLEIDYNTMSFWDVE